MKSVLKEKELYYGIMVLLFITFMAFIFAPFEIYLSGKDNYFFSGDELIIAQLLMFSVSFILGVILFIVIDFFSKKIFRKLMILLFSIGVSFYIQGNFVPFSYGTLNGQPIDWSHYKIEGYVSIVLFMVPIIVGLIVSCVSADKQKILKGLSIISICVMLVQVITLSTLFITNNGLKKENVCVSTTEGECSLSQEQNFIIFVLDTFDSQLFESFLNSNESKLYKEMMEDFTYYPNTVGAYCATELAIPQIITGQYFDNSDVFGNYLNVSYTKSPFISKLREKDWNINIYTECTMPQGEINKSINNVKKAHLTINSHRRLTQYIYMLVGFRYLPQQLKQLCWFYPDDMGTLKSLNHGEWESFSWSNQRFYSKIDELDTNQKQNTFQLYHLEGTHIPFTTHEDLLSVSGEDVGIETESIGVWLIIQKFLTKLKDKEIYDNTAIIIMGDHGYYGLRQNPIFMVKGIKERHDLKIKHTPVSYADLQDIYNKLLDKNYSDNILDISESDSRERLFYEYGYKGTLTEYSYAKSIFEYKSNKKASNVDAFYKTGHVFEMPSKSQ